MESAMDQHETRRDSRGLQQLAERVTTCDSEDPSAWISRAIRDHAAR